MVTSCKVSVVVLLVVRVEKYPVPVSIGGEAGTGEVVVELVLDKPGRMRDVAVAISSTVVVLVLVPESTEVLVLVTVVLSETLEVSET